MMNLQDKLKAMMAGGAACQVDGIIHLLGAAAISPTAPGVFWWHPPFAMDQHHFHWVRFTRATQVHERDLELTYPGGSLYIAPVVEWPGLDIDDARTTLARWASLTDFERGLYEDYTQTELALAGVAELSGWRHDGP